MQQVRLIDTTLRDGSHAIAHSFSPEQAGGIAAALSHAGVRRIEVGHGDGLLGSSCQYGFSKYDEFAVLRSVVDSAPDSTVGVLLIPGIGTIAALEKAYSMGARMVRVATHVTEADVGAEHIRHAKKIGMEAIGFLMMSHMAEPACISEQAQKFESYGADAVYMADSAGALLPSEVASMMDAVKSKINLPVGFHAHNNMGLAIGNSVAALQHGADYIDVTLRGLGAGAGNAPHEIFVAVIQKLGLHCGENLYSLMDAAEALIPPLGVSMISDMGALTIGYAGVYGSFYLHAKRAAERYHVDLRDILMELGRLKTVGGQEDMIIEVAARLAGHSRQNGVSL